MKQISNLDKILDVIESTPTKQLTIHLISHACGYSPWHFQRMFRAITGQLLGEYLKGRQLTIAAQCLLESQDSILSIALESGFSSQESFSRSFKSRFGETPKSFRDHKTEITPLKKPLLTRRYIDHIKKQHLEPTFVILPQRYLVGIDLTLQSPLSYKKSDYLELIQLWKNFNSLDISNRVNTSNIGILKSPSKKNEENELTYIACCEVSSLEKIPKECVALTIPEMSYAMFQNQGPAGSVAHLIDYIYGTWLTKTHFQRANSYDFESFSSDFSFSSQSSLTQYHVPILQRT